MKEDGPGERKNKKGIEAVDSGRIGRIIKSGLLLRCPRCGVGALFSGPFAMYSQCPGCALRFEREQGYFVGAIYVNYAITVVITLAGFFLLDYLNWVTPLQQLMIWIPVAIIFPLLFFRHSRSLWLAIDHIFNPADPSSRL